MFFEGQPVSRFFRDEFGGAVRVLRMFGERGDAGDAEELFQLVEETRFILADVGVGGLRHVDLF